MKKEILKYFWGDYISPLGRPSLVLVGHELEDKVIIEKYYFFEDINGKQTHIGELIESPIIPNFSDDLEMFMGNEGLEHAKSTIYFEALKVNEKNNKNKFSFNDIKVELIEANDSAFLLYLKRNAETHLNWIYKSTSSQQLKSLIDRFKTLKITVKNLLR